MFVIQPKGLGKSLIFQSAPILFDIVRPRCGKSIVLVISPLVSFMLDQVRFLKSLGISAKIIGHEQNCAQARKKVKRRWFQIVYSSPEAFFFYQKMTSSGFGLGKISPYDKLFADSTLLWSSPCRSDFVGAATHREFVESEVTPRNVRWRIFASCFASCFASFSKRFKERKQQSLQI